MVGRKHTARIKIEEGSGGEEVFCCCWSIAPNTTEWRRRHIGGVYDTTDTGRAVTRGSGGKRSITTDIWCRKSASSDIRRGEHQD